MRAIPCSFASLLRVLTSALPSRRLAQLAAQVRVERPQVHVTMEDSDFCGSPFRLTGDSGLCGWLARATAADLPAFTGLTSRCAVHADPAGVWPRGWRLSALGSAAFAQTAGARLFSGFSIFEAHWMWFVFTTAHRFSSRRARPSLPRGGTGAGLSVVNRPIRPVGLSPTFSPVVLAAAP